MSGVIYLIKDDGKLVEMQEQEYDSEYLLQELLSKYPNVLAGDQINATAPRRWLLISREVPLPSKIEGVGRWSVDHLFLDQDAIPTLIEVKRRTDTRIRREVVGQMLEYAANAVTNWSIEAIRGHYEANCERQGIEPEIVLTEFLGGDTDLESFWQRVKTNLNAANIRLVLVADEIPAELVCIINFLNKQMDSVEVIAIEVKQYVGQGLKTLVPQLVSQIRPPSQPTSRQWDEPSFFSQLKALRGADEAQVARRILEWAKGRSLRIAWGKGQKDGALNPMLDYQGANHWTFAIWTSGSVAIQFGLMQNRPPFDSETKRMELLQRLKAIPSVAIPDDTITKYPSIALSVLKNEVAFEQFIEAFDWMIQQIKQYKPKDNT